MTVSKTMFIGFDISKSDAEALAEAVEEFTEAAAREGRAVVGDPKLLILHSPERTALGEYSVRVTGEWSNGDQ